MSNKVGVSTSKGFYDKDNRLPLSVDNAENAILNSDGTYSGFTKDENGVLRVGDTIIPQKQELEFTYAYDDQTKKGTITFSKTLADNDKLQFDLEVKKDNATSGVTGGSVPVCVTLSKFTATDGTTSLRFCSPAFKCDIGTNDADFKALYGLSLDGISFSIQLEYVLVFTGGAAPQLGNSLNTYNIAKIYKIIE